MPRTGSLTNYRQTACVLSRCTVTEPRTSEIRLWLASVTAGIAFSWPLTLLPAASTWTALLTWLTMISPKLLRTSSTEWDEPGAPVSVAQPGHSAHERNGAIFGASNENVESDSCAERSAQK